MIPNQPGIEHLLMFWYLDPHEFPEDATGSKIITRRVAEPEVLTRLIYIRRIPRNMYVHTP